jgi:hypothetical protein
MDVETDADLGREVLGDDDPELARFFAGEDLSSPYPVPGGGKGLRPEDD